jgi:hypothetical protein
MPLLEIKDPNAGMIFLKDKSLLESRILESSNPAGDDIRAFLDMFNGVWGLGLDEKEFRDYVKRGLTIGSYIGGNQVNLLQTRAFKIDGLEAIEKIFLDHKDRAYQVCNALSERIPEGYKSLIESVDEHDANTMVLADLTTCPNFEGRGIASAVISYFKVLYLQRQGLSLPYTHDSVRYVLTFSPKPEDYSPEKDYMGGAVGLHKRNGAFDTGFIFPDARPNYPLRDVVFTSYAAPGFQPSLPRHTVQRKVNAVVNVS